MNKERKIVSLIREISAEKGYSFNTFSYDWVKHLGCDGKDMYIYGYNFPLNSTSFTQIANDKGCTYEILSTHGIPAVPHHYFMNPADIHYVSYLGVGGNWRDMLSLLEKHGKLIVKPNSGTGGTGLRIVEDTASLEAAVHQLFIKESAICICPMLNIQNEFRTIILDDEVQIVFRKERPSVIGNGKDSVAALCARFGKKADANIDTSYVPCKNEKFEIGWRHNLGNGASPEIIESGKEYEEITTLSKMALKLLGGRFASVDCVCVDGKLYVLEINSGVMMDNLAESSIENEALAKTIYKKAIEKYFEK